jgi:hypothetical protein
MAGAGYKLFNTGDVLTAAQVNTYLMEQTVMVFADAAARTTALTGVVSEGMISYLKDTNAVEVYNGSAWVSSDDPNAIQNTIVDAKGDLITATAADTPARLAVGNNGDTLLADSAATTGLRWQGNFAAGKNKIINGDFNIWQRGTSFTTAGAFTADRWQMTIGVSGSVTVSQQTFTAGAAPVAGYESQYFLRYASTNAVDARIFQAIEDVRTFANQTVTVSFWAKSGASDALANVSFRQSFGSGGSANVDTTSSSFTLTSSWARYSATLSIPSVSGKTIGANSYLRLTFDLKDSATYDFDLWGVQVEAGSVATAFQTATGTLQGELAACQRYYYRQTATQNYSTFGYGTASGTTSAVMYVSLPQTMRVEPTAVDYSTLSLTDQVAGFTFTTLTLSNQNGKNVAQFSLSGLTGLTQYRSYFIGANNSTSGYLGLSAEL